MALINCHECGGPVSTEAKACQNCGAKPKVQEENAGLPKFSWGTFSLIMVLLATLFLILQSRSTSDQQTKEEEMKAQDDVGMVLQDPISIDHFEASVAELLSKGFVQKEIQGDPKAKYLIKKIHSKESQVALESFRIGPSGISHTIKGFDCKDGTFAQLGENSSFDEITDIKEGNASQVVPGSIAEAQWRIACEG